MSKKWRGINDFYFVKGKTEEKQGEPVYTEEDTATEEEESPEVKLIEGKEIKLSSLKTTGVL